MLLWALIFFVLAVIAVIVGFAGAFFIAKILFYIFIALAIITLIGHLTGRRTTLR